MEKYLFEEVEDQLKKYYAKESTQEYLESKLKILDKQIASIESDLKNCNIHIECSLASPGFEARVQTSSDGVGCAEREAMRVTDVQLKRLADRQLERQGILIQIDSLETACNEITWKIKDFNKEQVTLLELLYKNKCYEQEVADKMFITQCQVNKRKKVILAKIFMWDGWNKVG